MFVDIGAWDWRDGSTTYYLEKHLGWTGIAVDAQESVRQGHVDNRPGTRFFTRSLTAHLSGRRLPSVRRGVLEHPYRFDRDEPFRHHVVNDGQERVDLLLGIHDLDDDG